VHVESTSAAVRGRSRTVSPERFVQLATASAAMLLVVVATGATVRLTASGLGCEHWPGCQPGNPFPAKGYHSYVEFGNRLVAFVTIVATLAAAVAAFFVAALPRPAKWLAVATFVGTLGQAPLGALTVYFHLNPWLVLSHLLLSLVVLAAGIVVALEARALVRGRGAVRPPLPLRRAGLVLLASCGTLVVTGTLATAGGPHPGSISGEPVRRLWSFEHAIWLHVRATAVFGILFLALLVWCWRQRQRYPLPLRAALLVLGLLLLQMAIGETQYRTQLPWWLVLGHVTVAAAVWAATVALVVLLWRPLGARRRA
jgi:cytochrome c oxidase assembly protein subunit 15